MSDSVTAFAPASIGNVAVGFDMLGLALDGEIHPYLSTDPTQNIASAMEQACRALGIECQSWVSSMNADGAHLEG